jgi:hypothetical protein
MPQRCQERAAHQQELDVAVLRLTNVQSTQSVAQPLNQQCQWEGNDKDGNAGGNFP